MGGITLASRLGEELGVGTTFAEKAPEYSGGFTFKRLPPQQPPTTRVILTEDTITTGSSVEGVRLAVQREMPHAEIFPIVVALCNRSGMQTLPSGLHICALIDRHMPTWDEGKNPYTRDGKEIVEPVRPKTHWIDLTREY
jgi:orotate phosphoribosyltransferase